MVCLHRHPSSSASPTASGGVCLDPRVGKASQRLGKASTTIRRDFECDQPTLPLPNYHHKRSTTNTRSCSTNCCRMAVARMLSDGCGVTVGLPRLPRFGLCRASSHMSFVVMSVLVRVSHRVCVRGHSLYLCMHCACLRCGVGSGGRVAGFGWAGRGVKGRFRHELAGPFWWAR